MKNFKYHPTTNNKNSDNNNNNNNNNNTKIILSETVWNVSKYGVPSGPHFPAFGLNTERYVVSVWMQENTDQNKLRIWSRSVTHLEQNKNYGRVLLQE